MAKRNVRNNFVPNATNSVMVGGRSVGQLMWTSTDRNFTDSYDGLHKICGYAFSGGTFSYNGPFISFGADGNFAMLQYNPTDRKLYMRAQIGRQWTPWSAISSAIPASINSDNMTQNNVIEHIRGGVTAFSIGDCVLSVQQKGGLHNGQGEYKGFEPSVCEGSDDNRRFSFDIGDRPLSVCNLNQRYSLRFRYRKPSSVRMLHHSLHYGRQCRHSVVPGFVERLYKHAKIYKRSMESLEAVELCELSVREEVVA